MLGVGLVAAPAHAQVAEQLFREGKRLMSEGKTGEACTAFDGSYRKDPAVTTLLNLADCREKNGELASAWGHFIEAERMTRGKSDQATFNLTAKDRSVKLEGRLSYLIINVPDEARVDGLTITRNGQPVDQAEWNRDIPVDGGTWKVEGKAPAYEAWSTTVTVGKEKDKQSVNVPKFRELPQQAVDSGGGAGPAGPVDRPSSFTGKRKAALGVGAVGVLGLAAGTFLYTQASGTYDDAKKATTNADRTRLTEDANGQYLQAQIGWGVGAAALGAAAVLWFTGAPASSRSGESGVAITPRVDATGGGLVVTGRF
jgi:hypothetical protein